VTTNTSSLPLAVLADGLERPERFASLHWFNPPELIELVEVVGSEGTAPETIETLQAWVEALGKAPIVVRRDVPGFVANRLQHALLREAYALVDAGVCSLADVDRAVTHGLGARWAAIGPFETMDLAGLDHDHDGSCGAIYVIDGRVTEEPLVMGRPALVREHGRGDTFAFDGGHIHRMHHHDPCAVAIHVYSPPIRRLGVYEVTDGILTRRPQSADEETPETPSVDAAMTDA